MDRKAKYEQQLTQSRETLKDLLASLNEEQWQTVVISEGQTWTVSDVVAHLLENEIGMSIHIHKTRQGKETVPEGFDVNEWNAGMKERKTAQTPQELLGNLDKARARTLQGLRELEEHEWSLKGRHPVQGMITIEQYYETIAGHDTHHANDIKQGLGIS